LDEWYNVDLGEIICIKSSILYPVVVTM
jgi:hypothetical protein